MCSDDGRAEPFRTVAFRLDPDDRALVRHVVEEARRLDAGRANAAGHREPIAFLTSAAAAPPASIGRAAWPESRTSR